MSGFIANGGGSADAEPFILTNDGWFPDINAAHLRESMRLDGSITDARLEVAAVNAMITVNRDLADYKAREQANGHAALVEVPAVAIKGESELVHLYRRAVYCSAGAELAERYRSYDATAAGNQRADDLGPSIDEYRRDARWAIRDLLGAVRTTVELI